MLLIFPMISDDADRVLQDFQEASQSEDQALKKVCLKPPTPAQLPDIDHYKPQIHLSIVPDWFQAALPHMAVHQSSAIFRHIMRTCYGDMDNDENDIRADEDDSDEADDVNEENVDNGKLWWDVVENLWTAVDKVWSRACKELRQGHTSLQQAEKLFEVQEFYSFSWSYIT
jgi:hypothetical protein